MKTIAFHLQKGGVGKTSLSAAVAYELAKKGRAVLIDIDPQGNLSSWLAIMQPRHELANVLLGKANVEDAITPTVVKGLDLLATFGLAGELKVYAENGLGAEPFIICDLMERIEAMGYEYAIMDLSPGAGRLERAAIIAANEVVAPMLAEEFSIDGIAIFNHDLAATMKAMRRAPEFKRIIINAFDARIGQHKAIAKQAQDSLRMEFFTVPVDPAFMKAQAAHTAVQDLPKKAAAKPETLAELKRIGDALCL